MKFNLKEWKSITAAIGAGLVSWSALAYKTDTGTIVAVLTAMGAIGVSTKPKKL